MSNDLAAAARTARPLPFALGQQDDTRDTRIEFAAGVDHRRIDADGTIPRWTATVWRPPSGPG